MRFLLFLVMFLGLSFLYSQVSSSSVYGLEDCTERKLRDLGVAIINCAGDTAVCTAPSANSAPNVNTGSRIYVLGDSITDAARTDLIDALSDTSLELLSINAVPGRAVSVDTVALGNPTGIEAIQDDKELISDEVAGADTVVIALGTNSGTEDLGVQIPALINEVRANNSKTQNIFWVNTFYEDDSSETRNQTIARFADELNFTVIDASSANIELTTDRVHPTINGNAQFARFVVDSLTAGPSVVATSGGGYDPIALNYPSFPNEEVVAQAITSYITERKPDSPWLGIDADFGSWLMRESKSRNINPLLILAIGKQENQFGTSDVTHVSQFYNYFGIKISSDSYRQFGSPEEGILYFLDDVQENLNGEDPNYVDVLNF